MKKILIGLSCVFLFLNNLNAKEIINEEKTTQTREVAMQVVIKNCSENTNIENIKENENNILFRNENNILITACLNDGKYLTYYMKSIN